MITNIFSITIAGDKYNYTKKNILYFIITAAFSRNGRKLHVFYVILIVGVFYSTARSRNLFYSIEWVIGRWIKAENWAGAASGPRGDEAPPKASPRSFPEIDGPVYANHQ